MKLDHFQISTTNGSRAITQNVLIFFAKFDTFLYVTISVVMTISLPKWAKYESVSKCVPTFFHLVPLIG